MPKPRRSPDTARKAAPPGDASQAAGETAAATASGSNGHGHPHMHWPFHRKHKDGNEGKDQPHRSADTQHHQQQPQPLGGQSERAQAPLPPPRMPATPHAPEPVRVVRRRGVCVFWVDVARRKPAKCGLGGDSVRKTNPRGAGLRLAERRGHGRRFWRLL